MQIAPSGGLNVAPEGQEAERSPERIGECNRSAELARFAQARDLSLAWVVRRAISDFVERHPMTCRESFTCPGATRRGRRDRAHLFGLSGLDPFDPAVGFAHASVS